MKKNLLKQIGSVCKSVPEQGEQRYIPLSGRISIAVPVAILMVLVGKRWSWIINLFANHVGLLLVSALGSFVIVVVVAGFAHWANRWLDVHSDWRGDFKNRLIAQIAFPLAGGWIISILMAIGLFACFGIDINASGYLRFEVWIVLFLLGLMNTGYAFWWLHKQPPEPEREVAYIEVTAKGNETIFVSELDIGCIHISSGVRLVRMIDGEIHHSNQIISELEKILDPDRFYKLKRKYLLNISVIGKLVTEKEVKKNTLGEVMTTKYNWVLKFGNQKMGYFQEKLVKGTVKYFEIWWRTNSNKKNRK